MTLPAFDYHRAASVAEAVAMLVEQGEGARLLAGGHSLLPLMRRRRSRPRLLIDLGGLAELAGIDDGGDHLHIGALTRHHDVATSPLVAAEAPLLARAASLVGDPQVRNRGTIGGSLAHADPAADLAAAALALDATVVITGPGGERHSAVGGLFGAPHRTTLAATEVLTAIRVPKRGGAPWSYQRFSRRAQDWPTVAVAAVGDPAAPRVALAAMAAVPWRARAVEEALAGGASAEAAATLADEGCDPPSDLAASADYRRHLARILTRRALEEAS
ncbi:MAG TPA: FAD binding domain-containing protein [Acidimicrobiales bacterium]|nr:FAD binding domain-containing protein [Acidimicrobiales bacterium]